MCVAPMCLVGRRRRLRTSEARSLATRTAITAVLERFATRLNRPRSSIVLGVFPRMGPDPAPPPRSLAMRILILSQYFAPEVTAARARIEPFAAGLAERGHD